MRALAEFSQQVLSGTAVGCIYALVALGFVLIYKATEVVNFAQGELLMLGAFCAYTLVVILGLPYWLGLILTPLLMAGLGGALERTIIRPIIGQPVFAIVLVTVGVGLIARSLVSQVPGWGVDTHIMASPFTGRVLRLGSLTISYDQLAIIAITATLVIALFLFFNFTRLGMAMDATSQNQLAADYVGVPVQFMHSLIWALSAAVAALAGILLAPVIFVHVNMGLIGLKAFPAAVLGGFASLPGAIAGGLIIGIVESLAGFYLAEGFKDISAYVVLLLALALRPQGLFGERIRKKV